MNGSDGGDFIGLDAFSSTTTVMINGGNGKDQVEFDTLNAATAATTVMMGDGDDLLTTSAGVVGSLVFEAGAGDDQWIDTNMDYAQAVDVLMGSGIDEVLSDGSTFADAFHFDFADSSSDALEQAEFLNATFSGRTTFRGAAGAQNLIVRTSTFENQFDVAFGGGDDFVGVVDSQSSISTVASMGSGADRIVFSNSGFQGFTMLEMAGGFDDLEIGTGVSLTGMVSLSGGSGEQDVARLGQVFVSGATLSGFETITLYP